MRRSPISREGAGLPNAEEHTLLRRLQDGFLWVLALGLALGLNLLLFGLMPQLIGRVPQRIQLQSPARPVHIIHWQPRRPPPRRVNQAPPAKARTVTSTVRSRHPLPQNQKISPQPLSVDFRPELPSLPGGLPTLPLQTVALAGAAPEAKAFYSVNALDAPLVPISRVPPIYPLVARRKGIEGWVKVKFLVTRRGTVERISIVVAHPRNVFEKNVLRAVSRWRFKPGTVNGKPVATWAESTLEFKLQ